eukprot:5903593-Alexandrium_andersonii.AAC.1
MNSAPVDTHFYLRAIFRRTNYLPEYVSVRFCTENAGAPNVPAGQNARGVTKNTYLHTGNNSIVAPGTYRENLIIFQQAKIVCSAPGN